MFVKKEKSTNRPIKASPVNHLTLHAQPHFPKPPPNANIKSNHYPFSIPITSHSLALNPTSHTPTSDPQSPYSGTSPLGKIITGIDRTSQRAARKPRLADAGALCCAFLALPAPMLRRGATATASESARCGGAKCRGCER